MTQESPAERRTGWMEASGLTHLLRVLGFSADPAKLALGMAAIIATLCWGSLLDLLWSPRGGVGPDAIARAVYTLESGETYEEPSGDFGVFELFCKHERRAVVALFGIDTALGSRVLTLHTMGAGVWWLARHHFVFAMLFGAGALFFWSVCGGAICRMASLQFARDEKVDLRPALRHVKKNLIGGYVLAPCIPLAFLAMMFLVLAVGGLVLSIPVLGDLIGGLAFGLAILGGFIIVVLLAGLLIGGSLLFPAVATDGSDAFDAFSRSVSYVFSKPWKTVIYVVIAGLYASICWSVARWVTAAALTATRAAVGFGTSPFGLWSRGEEGQAVSKLDLLWPVSGGDAMHAWPDWSQLAWYECFSGALIGVCVLLTVVLLWSFLASFYYCGSTVVYTLLRRDVDGTELDEVSGDQAPSDEAGAPIVDASDPTGGKAVTPATTEGDAPTTTKADTPAANKVEPTSEEPRSTSKPSDGAGDASSASDDSASEKPSPEEPSP